MELDQLKAAGLAEYETKAYFALLKHGNMTGKAVAKKSGVHPTSVYAALKSLQEKKLVIVVQKEPMIFSAVKPEVGIEALMSKKIDQLNELKKNVVSSLKQIEKVEIKEKPAAKISIYSGVDQLWEAVYRIWKNAKKEILLISVGEKVPSRIMRIWERQIQDGIKSAFIINTKNGNRRWVQEFLKVGVPIRYYPIDKEFSLSIIDQAIFFLVVKNPVDPEDRITIILESPGLAKANAQFFWEIWKKAEVVRMPAT